MFNNLHMHLFTTSAISVVAVVAVSFKWTHGAGMKLTDQ